MSPASVSALGVSSGRNLKNIAVATVDRDLGCDRAHLGVLRSVLWKSTNTWDLVLKHIKA